MSRPEHLNCVNTAEGIRRINEEQVYYDKDPERYEAEEIQREENRQQEEDNMRLDEERSCQQEYEQQQQEE